MKKWIDSQGLVLVGLDGANPLAFLAAIGTAAVASEVWANVRIHWTEANGWRPVLTSCEDDAEQFIEQLHRALLATPMTVFEIDGKLPFDVAKYITSLKAAVETSGWESRRDCDLLAAFGTEMYPETDSKKVLIFQDTRFRMVRSGDSAGQGLPAYVKSIRRSTDVDHLRRTLFRDWDYQDDGFSLRWDPVEDQRYALRWRDPSKSGLSDGPGVMVGANSLAIEALRYFPTVPFQGRAETTGFCRGAPGRTYFSWPIWDTPIGLDTVRSLVSLAELRNEEIPRDKLTAMGIVEIFRSQRIQQNQYYSNFTPAQPA